MPWDRFTLALGLILVSTAIQAAPLSHLYAFGDSYSDNGAGLQTTRQMVANGVAKARAKPGDRYWQGRWSNGPVAVEVMARELGLPLTDFAIGGARSGKDNYYDWMNQARPTGMQAQVQDYLDAHDSRADPNALYFLFSSANDFFAHEDFNKTTPIDSLARSAIDHITSAVERLAKAGALHVLVVGSVDLSHVPAVVAGNDVADAQQFQRYLNIHLPQRLQAISQDRSLDIRYFDHLAFTQQLRSHAADYQLTDLNTPCQPSMPSPGPRCAQPAHYFYWDEWHPTHTVHALLGHALAEQFSQHPAQATDHTR